MNLKGTLFAFFVLTQMQSGVCQFKNIVLEETVVEDDGRCLPSVAVNPRRPENIVAVGSQGNIFFTKDWGKTWSRSNAGEGGNAGNPAVISDDKGNYFYFHLSDPSTTANGSDSGKTNRVLIHTSSDGGATWSAGETMALNNSANQFNQWATTDSRGALYVTWTQLDKVGDACQSTVWFSMSKNGKKWSDPVTISQQPGNCTLPGALPAVTYDGKVLIAWSDPEKILLDRSFNGGEWWLSNDIVVEPLRGGADLKIPGHGNCNGMPVLMTDISKGQLRGSLYMVWADQRNGEGDTDIWFTRSHNFGDNWASPMRVNDDGKGKHQYLPWMAVDGTTGYIYVAYYDRRDHDDNQTDVYLAYSTDGGASFKNRRISETPFTPEEGQASAPHLTLSAQKGVIVPVWTRTDAGKTSVWTAVIRHEELSK